MKIYPKDIRYALDKVNEIEFIDAVTQGFIIEIPIPVNPNKHFELADGVTAIIKPKVVRLVLTRTIRGELRWKHIEQ